MLEVVGAVGQVAVVREKEKMVEKVNLKEVGKATKREVRIRKEA